MTWLLLELKKKLLVQYCNRGILFVDVQKAQPESMPNLDLKCQ